MLNIYRLVLVEDKRSIQPLKYFTVVGRTLFANKKYWIKTVPLWDSVSQSFIKDKVVLTPLKRDGNLIYVEIKETQNAIL